MCSIIYGLASSPGSTVERGMGATALSHAFKLLPENLGDEARAR